MGLERLFRRKRKPLTGSPAANDALRARLHRYGDDGLSVRHVLHYAYPQREADLAARQTIIDSLRERGFTVSDAAVGSGVVLEHFHSVAADCFDIVTAELSAWFSERGWDYDGWECEVIQPRHRDDASSL